MNINCLIVFASFYSTMVLTSNVHGARHLETRIDFEGVVVFRAPNSDDGTPDPDEVWRDLANVRFRPTKEFGSFAIKSDADGPVVRFKVNGRLYVQYGGMFEFEEIRILKEEVQNGTLYRIDPEQIARWANRRMLTRRDAARLANPHGLAD